MLLLTNFGKEEFCTLVASFSQLYQTREEQKTIITALKNICTQHQKLLSFEDCLYIATQTHEDFITRPELEFSKINEYIELLKTHILNSHTMYLGEITLIKEVTFLLCKSY